MTTTLMTRGGVMTNYLAHTGSPLMYTVGSCLVPFEYSDKNGLQNRNIEF